MQGMFTRMWHSQVDHLWLSLTLPRRQSRWLSFVRGRAAWCLHAPWRCSCHPRMGKWQGRWVHRVAPGSVSSILAWWKSRDREPSLAVHWSRASPPLATVRAKGQIRPADGSCMCIPWSDSFSHPGNESLSLWSSLRLHKDGHFS